MYEMGGSMYEMQSLFVHVQINNRHSCLKHKWRMTLEILSWRTHRRATIAFVHLLLPCGCTFSLQTTHAVEFVGIGQHEVCG